MKKKTVAILGATGMLGSALYGELKNKYELVLLVRDPNKLRLLEKAYGGLGDHKVTEFDALRVYDDFLAKNGHPSGYLNGILEKTGQIDYAINALGITIPFAKDDPAKTFFINSALPHILAVVFGPKLIHITTDCAYDGKEGFPYDENSPKTPTDLYGLSKSLGEPTSCLTLRTSIIGRELEGFTGLLEWFLQQKGKTMTGFANHFWNGVTTKQFGKICDEIIENPAKYPRTGIYHVFSTTVSKYDMLLKFREKYNIDCEIMPEQENKLNRTLATVHPFNGLLHIPSFDQMILEL